MAETNFMLANTGNAPAPKLDAPEEVRYRIEIPELSGEDNSKKTSKINQHDAPTLNMEKHP